MSDAYGTRLVDDGRSTYDRVATAVVAGSFVAFALAAATLFGWVPVAGATAYFGGGLLAIGLTTAALGLGSWRGLATTTPDRSPGLVVGFGQGILWAITTGAIASNTVGLGSPGWLVGLPAGVLVGYLTIATREDLGATLPAAAFVSFVGAVVLAGVISPTWTWEPAAFDASFPGTIVIPFLTMTGGLIAGWAAAVAAAGFGTRGRQHGAFLLISLVVLLVLSVLAFLLAFVFERGVAVVVENLVLSAGSLVVIVGTALALLVRFGRVRPALADGPGAVLAFVRFAVALALGAVGLGLIGVVLTGREIAGYAVTLEPSASVGAVPALVAGGVLLVATRHVRASWEPATRTGRRVARGLRLAAILLAALAVVEVVTWHEVAIAGVAILPTVGVAVGGVGLALVVASLVTARGGAEASWVPPVSRSGELVLGAFVLCSLHVAITGYGLGVGPLRLVGSGTVDWPFLMNPSQGLGIQLGVMPAVLGTVWIVLGAVVFAVPLAVGAAVFLTEYAEDSAFTRAVDVATNGLWSTPSIVFGLFGLAFLVPRFGGTPSIFAAQLVLGFMLLPLVLITSREAIKSVPDEYRDASAALGVSKWDTIRDVVVPAAMPGVTTGVILGVGRIAGETAPLLLVLNGPNFPNAAPGVLSSFTFDVGLQPPFVHVSNPALLDRASALPYQLYAIITAGVGAEESFGWGTTLVLLGVVLGFFAIGVATRRYFRTKLHQ